MAHIAINGLGRIGKLLLRALIHQEVQPHEISLLNDAVGSPELHAHLLEFDTVHGRWSAEISSDSKSIIVDDRKIPMLAVARIDQLPLKEAGIDLVIDCTGFFKTPERVQSYFRAGVKKVLVSAPIKSEPALNLVYGINHHLYDPLQHHLITAASCTTNCLAPVVKVLHEEIGIQHGSITTIHNVTNTQTIVDRPVKDLRRARSALNSLIPTTTGSATAITLIYPDLNGRLNGHAVRVPLLNASLTDCVFELKRPTTVGEVNQLFETYANGSLQGILGFERRPLVSTDYVNDPRSAIIDGISTMVVNDTQVKVYAWYDNEWGYVMRMADLTKMILNQM